jgi:signal transduction histidine kinase
MKSDECTNEYSSIEDLSQLTGGLAHEIRNPLSTLKVNLQLLSEDIHEIAGDDNDNGRRSVLRIERMQAEVNRLRDILDDFIQFVGHHHLNLQTLDMNNQLKQLIEFYEPQAAASKVRMLQQYSPESLRCEIDPDLLKQAFLNLFINAQQAMSEGGDLMVRTSQTDGQAHIEITDTGPGIPDEIRDKLFKAYVSSKQNGTGLGLATTKRIIEEHKGKINVHSEAGKGTSFTILLPLANAVSNDQTSTTKMTTETTEL